MIVDEPADEAMITLPTTEYSFETDVVSLDDAHISISDEIIHFMDCLVKEKSVTEKQETLQWKEDLVTCTHITSIAQMAAQSNSMRCLKCEKSENLWTCLVCGVKGCGRVQFGGGGGNGHAELHFKETGHPVCVKVGTLSDGVADIFCYACGDERLDNDLIKHLKALGIDTDKEKSEQSLLEQQAKINMSFDFSMEKDGKEFQRIYGPGFTGFINLGNSCYIASTLQCLLNLSPVNNTFKSLQGHFESCRKPPANCLECQFLKLCNGLLSGDYSTEPAVSNSHTVQGIKPTSFKYLLGKQHEEFSTMKQQDAFEYLQHLLSKFSNHSTFLSIEKHFEFMMQQRLQCTMCQKCRYTDVAEGSLRINVPVPTTETVEEIDFLQCVKDSFAASYNEFKCPSCSQNTIAQLSTSIKTFPKVLCVVVKRFTYDAFYQPKKIISIIKPPLIFCLESFKGIGMLEGEELLEDIDPHASNVETLLGMGFETDRARYALEKCGGSIEQAMEWLFTHTDEVLPPKKKVKVSPTEQDLSIFVDMGFAPWKGKRAMNETNGDLESAIEWLFENSDISPLNENEEMDVTAHNMNGSYDLKAFISHNGTSTVCGHYVAYLKKGGVWYMFNDEKVVVCDENIADEARGHAYVYLYEHE